MTGNGSSQTGSGTGSEGKPPLMVVKLLGGEDGRFRLPFRSEIAIAPIAALESTRCFFSGRKKTLEFLPNRESVLVPDFALSPMRSEE